MNKEKITLTIYNALQERAIFEKYNSYYGFNFLEQTSWKKRLDYFSWGLYYLYICSLIKGTPTEEDYQRAPDIELLCMSAVFLDDFLDEDSPINDIISGKHLALLAFDSLLDTIDALAPYSFYHNIKEAMLGEWFDTSYTVGNPLVDEDFYFNSVMKKNIDILKFICQIADKENNSFWEEYAISQSVIFQLLNDVKAVVLSHKSDIVTLKPTLPLIKAHEVYGDSFLTADKFNRLKLVENSGAIEYCNYIIEEEKENCITLLESRFNNHSLLKEFLVYSRVED